MSFPNQSAASLIEITATYRGERFRFAAKDPSESDTVVAEVLRKRSAEDNVDLISTSLDDDSLDEFGTITVKGPADLDELKDGLEYRFYGRWTTYKNKRTGRQEKQFTFQTFTLCTPHNRQGIIRYLTTAPHIGTARARTLWEKFGSDAVRVAREEPETVVSVLSGVSLEKAQEAAKYLDEQSSLENMSIGLIELTDGRGFPKTLPTKIRRKWGNKGEYLVRRNPFLLGMNFKGCGFKRCDALYMQLGLPPAKLKRQTLSAWFEISSERDGSTWYPRSKAEKGIKSSIAGAEQRVDDALKLGKRSGLLSEMIVNGQSWIAEGKKARQEAELAQLVVDSLDEVPVWDEILDNPNFLNKLGPDGEEHQRKNLANALTGIVGYFGGGPGTGKTYTVTQFIKALVETYGASAVAVAAPFGKAAVKNTIELQKIGVPIRARTNHSMLGVAPGSATDDRDGGWTFKHNKNNPLPFRFIIVEEKSTLDVFMNLSIMRARAKGTHILFVGDIGQLPPIGHGAPARDCIAAGLPYGELTETRRNSGRIVQVCKAIKERRPWTDSPEIDISKGENLKILPCMNPEEQTHSMLFAIRKAAAQGLNPIWDCQVIVPVNAKSDIGRKRLNVILQNELNENPIVPGSPFRVGDKVVNRKNTFFEVDFLTLELHRAKIENDNVEDLIQNDKGEVYVANGELGEVLSAEESMTIIKLETPLRVIKVPKGKVVESKETDDDERDDTDTDADNVKTNTGCSWELGYALTVHSYQGSEIPVAIVMLDEYPGAKKVCSREWVTVAISRAKKLCLLIGNKATADSYCRKSSLAARKTFLRELIDEERQIRRERAIADQKLQEELSKEFSEIAEVEQQNNVVANSDVVSDETANSEPAAVTTNVVQILTANDWLDALA